MIELKDANTNLDERQNRHNDNRTPVEQAFGYQHKIGKDCKWVIVSNFNEIRLYHHSSSIEYEQFFIKELSDEEKLKRFFFLLGKENLISKNGISVIDSLFISNEQDEQEITKKFYAAFKEIRLKFFDHLKTYNPTIDENILLEKTQKLLDRFIFICFAEDNRLLPETIFKNMVKTAKLSFTYSDTKVWTELKGLFNAINVGSPPHNINKFNGGLFAADEVLDSLQIKDQILEELSSITDYDFESDVSIDILGHIFEQSINDLEEIKASINGEVFEKSKSKRKRDGIVYTPAYITRDIVEKAVGGWLEDRKIELGYYDLPELTDEDFKSIINNRGKLTYNDKIKQHLELWYAYRERLMNIKVLDPACGSGAFLIQVFDYLYAEGNKVNDMIAKLLGGQYEVFQLDKHILSNNIYGVDINSESVEITKLSLWLKTANKNAELTSLDNNIKCGNSLIDDPEVAGDKAFDWNTEFAEIMQVKIVNEELKAYHVTWATYNSRPVGFTNNGSPIILDDETRNQIAEYLDQKIGVEHYRVIAINVLKDHVHCIVVCKEDDLSEIVRNLKGFSSYKLHRDSSSAHQHSSSHPKLKLGVDTGSSIGSSTTINPTLQRVENREGHVEHRNEHGEQDHNSKTPSQKLWAKGYSHTFLNDDSHYLNTIHYIDNNHLKHEQSQLEYKFQNLTPLAEAFAPVVVRGGFDVVVGNPPYVNVTNLDSSNKNFFKLNYSTAFEQYDIYYLFHEKSIQLLKDEGYLSFINPIGFLNNKSGLNLRKLLLSKVDIYNIVDISMEKVFSDVSTYPIIISYKKTDIRNDILYFGDINNLLQNDIYHTLKKDSINESNNFSILLNSKDDHNQIMEKLDSNCNKLGQVSLIFRGMQINKIELNEKFYYSNLDHVYCFKAIHLRNVKPWLSSSPNYFAIHDDLKAGSEKRLLFEKEKLLIPRFVLKLQAAYDNNSYILDNIYIISMNTDNYFTKFILVLFNSSLLNYFYQQRFSQTHISGGYFAINGSQLKEIPIPIISLEAQQPFITLADTMLDKNKELQEKNNKFQELLKADCNIEKLNTKLENWYNLSWADFVNELKKLKITLSGEMKEDWIERFNRYKSQITELQNIIQTTDKKIDQLVYELYGLSEEEIKVIEGE